MADAHVGLAANLEVEMQQVVVVLVHRTGQGVLDGHDGAFHFVLLQAAEEILEARARDGPRRGEKLPDGLLVCVTEQKTRADIDALCAALGGGR